MSVIDQKRSWIAALGVVTLVIGVYGPAQLCASFYTSPVCAIGGGLLYLATPAVPGYLLSRSIGKYGYLIGLATGFFAWLGLQGPPLLNDWHLLSTIDISTFLLGSLGTFSVIGLLAGALGEEHAKRYSTMEL
jgi:Na+/proline symporter